MWQEHAAPEEAAEAAPAAVVEVHEPAVETKEEDVASPEVTSVAEPGSDLPASLALPPYSRAVASFSNECVFLNTERTGPPVFVNTAKVPSLPHWPAALPCCLAPGPLQLD